MCLLPGAGQSTQLGKQGLCQASVSFGIGVQLICFFVAEILPVTGHCGQKTAQSKDVYDRYSPHVRSLQYDIHIVVDI